MKSYLRYLSTRFFSQTNKIMKELLAKGPRRCGVDTLGSVSIIGGLLVLTLYFPLVQRLKTFPSTVIRVKEEEKQYHKFVLLFWSTFFGKPFECGDVNLENCSVPCEITSDKSRAIEAMAIFIHTRDPHPLPPNLYKTDTPLILFGAENPVYTPALYDKNFLANFNYLYSYNLERADFYLPSFGKPSIKPLPLPFSEKNGLVLAVFSHCETGRTAYLKELMKYIQVDSYGACLRNKQSNELVGRYGKDFKKAKVELARRYKFTLVFMNQDCDYFVDDQLTHALSAGSVPVYMGTDKIHELMAGNLRDAFIKVKNFETPKELAAYLKMASENEMLYNQYLRWKYEGFNFPSSHSSTKQGFAWSRPQPDYCSVCERLFDEMRGNATKPAGLIKSESCLPRKISDWLKQ